MAESTWQVPYCKACKRHVEGKNTIVIAAAFFGVVAICGLATLGVAMLKQLGARDLVYAIAGLVLVSIIALTLLIYGLVLRHLGRSTEGNCTAKRVAVRYLGEEEKFVHTFVFANKHYAEAFASTNGTKIDGEVPW